MLDGIPPAPRGVPQVEVTFELDSNGILNVKAQDKATSKEQHITITGSSNLSDDDIERMKKEAEEHASEDAKVKEEIETINEADATIYSTEKMIEELKDKIDDVKKKELIEKLDALKEEMKKDQKVSQKLNKNGRI